MKNRIVIATLVFLSGLTACSDDGGSPVLPNVSGAAVRLEGAIGLSTRAVIGSGYNEDLNVCFARQDETAASSDVYGGWSVHSAVRIGGAGPRPIVFGETQLYPAGGGRVRFHGYYPADGAGAVSTPGTGTVAFTIDGKTDVMATGRFTASPGQPSVSCTFSHLLTQLSFICYSSLADKWGTITKIEALDIPLGQQLDWTTDAPGIPVLTTPAGTPTGALPVQDLAPLVIPQVNEAETTLPAPKGYILLPVSAGFGTQAHPLWMQITTTKDGKGHEVPTVTKVPVDGDGFQVGRQHIVSLYFTDGIHIEVTRVSVAPWTDNETELPV